jgi:uncharacterized membrane protein
MRGGLAWSRARWAAGAALALLYAAGSHALMTHAQDSAWAMVVVLGPLVALAAAAAWGNGHRALSVAGVVVVLLLALEAAAGHGISSRWLYLAQHAGVHLALAAWFGATLRPGKDPLVSALARRVHRNFTPAMALYTRNVTLAWTLYFAGMAATSLVLFLAGDFARWSLLANILTPILTAAFFVGEYLVRYRLHPEFERVGLREAVRAYRSHAAGARSARQEASRP